MFESNSRPFVTRDLADDLESLICRMALFGLPFACTLPVSWQRLILRVVLLQAFHGR
jgi:hypothetical protein